MPPVTKTTVYLDEVEYRRLKALASGSGRSAAELVREAVAEYTRRHTGAATSLRSLGVARSGRGDVAERSEDLLQGFGRT